MNESSLKSDESQLYSYQNRIYGFNQLKYMYDLCNDSVMEILETPKLSIKNASNITEISRLAGILRQIQSGNNILKDATN